MGCKNLENVPSAPKREPLYFVFEQRAVDTNYMSYGGTFKTWEEALTEAERLSKLPENAGSTFHPSPYPEGSPMPM